MARAIDGDDDVSEAFPVLSAVLTSESHWLLSLSPYSPSVSKLLGLFLSMHSVTYAYKYRRACIYSFFLYLFVCFLIGICLHSCAWEIT